MTQQLTHEQLEFARSIGATHYDWEHMVFRKDGYFCKEEKARWIKTDTYNFELFKNIEPIDFSPPEYTPKVGEDFLYSGNGVSWEQRTMLFNDGITMLMADKKYPANRWHYKCDDPDVLFRPLPTEEEVEREKVKELLTPALRQYRHNDSDEFVAGYDKAEVEKIFAAYRLQESE